MSLTNPEFGSRLKESYEKDAWSKAMIQVLTNVGEPEDSSVARQAMNFSYDGSFIHWTGTGEGRVYIPKEGTLRTEVIEKFHDGSHFGRDKVHSSPARYANWHKMHDDVGSFVASCSECQKNKLPREKNCWDVATIGCAAKLLGGGNG